MKNRKRGFTLIELLVVVLIIGILAAVALPQYQKSVARARAAEAMINGTAIVHAEERYFLANGEYTSDLSALDIEVKDSDSYRYSVQGLTDAGNPYWRLHVFSKKTGLPSFEFPFYWYGKKGCLAPISDSVANSVCATYGPLHHSSSTINYYHGPDGKGF